MRANHKTAKGGLSRRGFLKGAAAAAGALSAAPFIVPASARGADGFSAPSDRITLGFIGMGCQNNGLLNNFIRQSDTQVVAVCDVETKRLNAARERVERHYADQREEGAWDGCEMYTDFRALLAREDIDAVVIATPDHWHAIQAVQACRAGKDVYCEKPLSLTVREGRMMVEAARRYKRVFQTGSMQRSDQRFRLGCELVRSGRIGEVKEVFVNVGGPAELLCLLPEEPVIPTLDWDGWIGPAPMRPYNAILCPDHTNSFPNWRRYFDFSGGGMTDWGAHHFDIAQWGLGMDATGPVEITPPDGGDVQRLTYRYANGVYMYHGGARGQAGVEFVGTEGRVLVNRGYLETEPGDLARQPIGPDDVRLYNSNNHYRDFLDCVQTRAKPICDVEIGHRSATVCHLGNIAYWTGRGLRWDPAKEELIGDGAVELARWLERPNRSPWAL